MKLGDKPYSEMSLEECREAIALLQSNREALRAEGVKKFKEAKAKRATRAAKTELVDTKSEAMRLLMGE